MCGLLGLILGVSHRCHKKISERINCFCLNLPKQGAKSLPSKGGVPFRIDAIFGQLTWGVFSFPYREDPGKSKPVSSGFSR
jgi:hypothetical protein